MKEHIRGQKEIQVIGAGFGRTGTLSLKVALEELGFGPCYHMVEVFDHLEHAPQWKAAAEGKAVHWHEMLAGYQATVDWPGSAFYKELMSVYPDAKVILSVRDPEKWYESAQETIFNIKGSLAVRLLVPLVNAFSPRMKKMGTVQNMVNAVVWDGTFHGRFLDKQYALEVFERHIEEVKQYVPPDRLLVYSVKEGWEPLCRFLGVEKPEDKPFPRLNDRANFPGNMIKWKMQRVLLGGLVIAGITGVALATLLARRRK